MHLSPCCPRAGRVSQVAPLGQEKATLGLKEALRVPRQLVRGKTPVQLDAVKDFLGETVQLARPERAAENRTVGRTGVDAAGDVEQLLAGVLLQLTPELIGAAEQRHVRGMFPVGQTDDAG